MLPSQGNASASTIAYLSMHVLQSLAGYRTCKVDLKDAVLQLNLKQGVMASLMAQ